MAGIGKVKALQIWCKNRTLGYKDVSVDNMTTSWRDGLAFCALIHRFRPDLIDFDSLSKENVYDNNALAFEVAQNGLNVPALLDAEDMVRLSVPDKLSIITYVAQLHNAFKDMVPAGGPAVKVPVKRHSPIHRSNTISSPDTKRKIVDKENKTNAKKSNELITGGPISPSSDVCIQCDGKVYLIEKHVVDGKMYHRSCYRDSNKAKSRVKVPPQSQSTSALNIHNMKPSSDNIPDWQKNLKRQSTALSNLSPSRPSSAIQEERPSISTQLRPTPKAEPPKIEVRVETRSPAPLRTGSKTRPMSSAVDMTDGLEKLRLLREQARSQRSGSPTIKERLQKLQNLAADHKGQPSNRPNRAESPLVDRRSNPLGAIDEAVKSNGSVAVDDSKTDDAKSSELASQTKEITPPKRPELPKVGAKKDEKPVEFEPSVIDEADSAVNSNTNNKTRDEPTAAISPYSHSSEKITVLSDSEQLISGTIDSVESKAQMFPIESEVESHKSTEADPMRSVAGCSLDTPQIDNAEDSIDKIRDVDAASEIEKSSSVEDDQSESKAHDAKQTPATGVISESPTQGSTTSVNGGVSDRTQSYVIADPIVENVSRKDVAGGINVPSTSATSVSLSPVAPTRTKHASNIKVRRSNEDLRPADKSSVAPPRPISAVPIHTTASALTTSTLRNSVDSISIESFAAETKQEGTDDPSKSPKPARPAGPPPSQKFTSPTKTQTADELPVLNKLPFIKTTTPSRPAPPVEMRKNRLNRPPPRPVTTATGSVQQSQFYMDRSHESVIDPPPKPLRSSALSKMSQAKDSWQDSLENWSSKRKTQPATTWYAAEEYPDENNPFAEDQSEEMTPKAETPVEAPQKNEQYNEAMNPFAEEESDSRVDETPSDRTKEECFNPFEESDGETEHTKSPMDNKSSNPFGEVTSEDEGLVPSPAPRKKIIPANPFSADSDSDGERKVKKPSKKGSNPITLPSIGHQKKKHAPAPPSVAPLRKQTSLEDLNSTTPSAKLLGDDNPEEVVKRKTKPAPPRPMPPKRRVSSAFDLDEKDVSHELSEIEQKQRELEEQGRRLEKAIRDADDEISVAAGSRDTISSQEDDLISQWLETVNQKNELIRREQELIFIVKHQELEVMQAEIEWQLRQIMHKAENLKTDDEKAEEEELIQQLVTIVTERSKLVDKMDAERMRHHEEDAEINNMMEEKQLTPSGSTSPTTSSDKKSKRKDKEQKKKDKGKRKLFG